MKPDIEEEEEPTRASTRRRQRQYGAGPGDLAGVLLLLRTLCFQLVASAREAGYQDVIDSLALLCMQGWLVTSTYSGMGTFEIAAAIIMDSLIDALGLERAACVGLVCYSACEVAAHCQTVLKQHPSCSRPKHLFRNILDRLMPQDREDLEGIEKRCLDEWSLWKLLFVDGLLTEQGLNNNKV